MAVEKGEVNYLTQGESLPFTAGKMSYSKYLLCNRPKLEGVKDESINLIVTSPPYFDLKEYGDKVEDEQLGSITEYNVF